MILSILICHLKSRPSLLERLMARLFPQIKEPEALWVPPEFNTYNESGKTVETRRCVSFGNVEILVESDERETTTGEKRNHLLLRASGDYICFVDDDDLVPVDYCKKILAAINSTNPRPDVIGFEGTLIRKGQPNRRFIHSMKHSTWFEKDNVYYRCPNHLNPVKRELALQVMFPDKTIGEDHDYSKKLYPLLKTEVYVVGSMYEYYCK